MKQDAILTALGEITRIVSETLELREVFRRVAKASAKVLPLNTMAIIHIESDRTLRLYSHTQSDLAEPPRSISLEDFSPSIRPSLDSVHRVSNLAAIMDPSFFVDRELLARGSRALLTAPLRQGDQTNGFVSIDSVHSGAFTLDHERVLLSIADLLSLALEHERLWNLDLARRRRLDAIDALLPILANVLDVRDIFNQVSAVVTRVLPHDLLVLASISPDEKRVNLDAYSGTPIKGMPSSLPLERDKRFPVGQEYDLIGDVRLTRDVKSADNRITKALGVRSILRIPIYLKEVPESTLNFLSKTPGQYTEEDVPVARRVADHVSLALSHRRLAEEERRVALLEQRVESLTKELQTTLGIKRVVGRSKKWRAALAEVAKVAPTETTVLLTGESGTGKEVLARMIHRGSPRFKGPFVAINCAALPETLLESELFGHEKGAFTGATNARPGCIEQAAGGVLFLDEVGEMSPAVQAKLLRVIEQREFTRVGGSRQLMADVRLITATNRDLKVSLARGEFRGDLYYRLRVFEITAPPLRERKDDIFPLSEAFLEEIGGTVGRPSAGISNQAQDALAAYPWPGNVRELRNVLERATILCDGGLITLEHLPSEVSHREPAAQGQGLPHPMDGVNLKQGERDRLTRALEQADGNHSQAARLLGITRPALYRKLQKHGLT